MDKYHFITIKNFCSSNDTFTKLKRQTTDQEKILLIHISVKGLVSRIFRECLQWNNKQKANPVLKMGAKNLTSASVQMTNKHLHWSSGKCKTKPQLNVTVPQYAWLKRKRLMM